MINPRAILSLCILLAFFAGIILLQIFLSKRENKWPGLVLPAISFLFSLLIPLNMIAPPTGVTIGFLFQLLILWALANIPTMILLAVYSVCRGKERQKKQMNKMNIRDL